MTHQEAIATEQLAITLYVQAVTKNKSALERVKVPTWLEIGIKLRNSYRVSARQLISEFTDAN